MTNLGSPLARWALVTGSTQGLGAALASQLEKSGWSVLRHGRRRPDAEVPYALGVDLSEPDGGVKLWSQALEATGGTIPELIVHCAACGESDCGCLSPRATPIIQTNFGSAVDLARLAVGAGSARVVMVSSSAARLRTHPAGAYCASKDLLETFVQHAAGAALPRTVICICRVDLLLDTALCRQLNGPAGGDERRDPRCALPLLLALSRTGPEAAGRVYCLSRALKSLPDELRYCCDAVSLRNAPAGYMERRIEDDRLVMNGDNHIEEVDGLYPSHAAERACAAAMAKCIGLPDANVAAVHGGITGAFDALCAALDVRDCDALVKGLAFGGLERSLTLRGVRRIFCQDLSTLKEAITPQTRLLLVTQPSCFFCEDEGSFIQEALQILPPSVVLVLDECYLPYMRDAPVSSAQLLSSSRHVVAGLRGLSKLHGLASLRLGFLVTDVRTRELVAAAAPFKPLPFHTLERATWCLSQEPTFSDERRRRYLSEKCFITKALRRLGVANHGKGPYIIVLANDLRCSSTEAVAYLCAKGIEMRDVLAPYLVFLLASRRWNAAFCGALADLAAGKRCAAPQPAPTAARTVQAGSAAISVPQTT